MLRNEPPFQALRMHTVIMKCLPGNGGVVAFSSDLRCHSSLEELDLHVAGLDTAAAMGAVADACVAIRLRRLELERCHIAPEALPELTRLVAAGAMRQLSLENRAEAFVEAHESTRLFVAAVRASAMK